MGNDTRVQRFKGWDRAHKVAVLKAAGLTLDEFRALNREDKKAAIGKGQQAIRQRSAQLDDPNRFIAPMTERTARQQAGNAANLVYGGQEQLAGQYGQSVDPWFDDYVRRTQANQQAQQTQAQGIIDQSVTQAQQQGQTVLPQAGVDPNSDAAQNDILAAASRKALADAFTKVLQGNQSATDASYVQQAGVAEAARVGEHTTANQQRQQISREKGQFRNQTLSELRDKAHTERLENAAFDLDVTKATLGANEKANEVNQYGVKNSTWSRWSASHRKRWIADFNKDTAKPSAPGEPKYGVNADDWATMSPAERKTAKDTWEAGDEYGKPGDGKDRFGNTKVQRRASNNAWDSGLEYLRSNRSVIPDPNAVTLVQQQANVPHDIAAVVVQWARNGGFVTPAQARKLRRLGVKVPADHIRRPQKPGTSSGGGGGPHGTGRP